MEYIEVSVLCSEDFREIFVAELSQEGFESFLETDTGIQAYIPVLEFESDSLRELAARYTDAEVSFVVKLIAPQNWNAEWEKNYEPIRIGDVVLVRAPFHAPDPAVAFDIVINPKMSFGTGHHATTTLMLQQLLQVGARGKRVYDVGTGTGILAIMAAKLGATHIEANDVEDWTVENCRDNCQENGCSSVLVYHGALPTLAPDGPYHLMLANINRNVLLAEIPLYYECLKPGGDLLLSGFYQEDVPHILGLAEPLGLEVQGQTVQDNWTCLHLQKTAV